jgi:hypothetical protein
MSRRRFLREGAAAGTLTLTAGGFLLVRRRKARAKINSRMLQDALRSLAGNSLKELQTLPVRAREDLNQVENIPAEVGSELDAAWA